MSNKKPDALELADMLESDCLMSGISRREHLDYRIDAVAELRRLHAANAELLEALKDLTLNVNEAMRTGGWVPTPLQRSFWDSMCDARAAITKHGGES